MHEIQVAIGTHLELKESDLPRALVDRLRARMTIPNPEKPRALKEMVRGAEYLPESIPLWEQHGQIMRFPRGFVWEFEEILRQEGYVPKWNSSMTFGRNHDWFCFVPEIPLREEQRRAFDQVLSFHGGIYQAPTGFGKTRVSLALVRELGQWTVILVEKTSIAHQWRDAALELGFRENEIGMIGEGKWRENTLTIALRQSLWSRLDVLDRDGWWDEWGAVIADECHHSVSETTSEIIQRFPAALRLGVSATAERDELTWPIVKATLGPIVHETTQEDAGEALMTPEIRVIDTEFEFDYTPTTRVVNPRTRRLVRVQNNYNEMMEAITLDPRRNAQIVETIRRESMSGHHVLVISRRREHLKILFELTSEMLPPDMFAWEQDDPITPPELHLLTGDHKGRHAQEVRSLIEAASAAGVGSVLFSTVAEEALDIPRLDRLMMAYPARKVPIFVQQVGRVLRRHPAKDDVVVYDVRDPGIGLLRSQFHERSQLLYARRGYKITFVNREEVKNG